MPLINATCRPRCCTHEPGGPFLYVVWWCDQLMLGDRRRKLVGPVLHRLEALRARPSRPANRMAARIIKSRPRSAVMMAATPATRLAVPEPNQIEIADSTSANPRRENASQRPATPFRGLSRMNAATRITSPPAPTVTAISSLMFNYGTHSGNPQLHPLHPTRPQ